MIISASRRTDLPAFFPEETIKKIIWYKRQKLVDNEVAVVFWSKNPQPIIEYLPLLDNEDIKYYFHFTLNDYPKIIEPNVPPIAERIITFKELSKLLGKEKVIWRHDPIYSIYDPDHMNDDYDIYKQIQLGDIIHEYTEKMVISFVDPYPYKVPRWIEHPTDVGRGGAFDVFLTKTREWGIGLATCAEPYQFPGVEKNKCVDPELLRRMGVKHVLDTKDSSQRYECGCIPSIDIGEYHTCKHNCIYCYAK